MYSSSVAQCPPLNYICYHQNFSEPNLPWYHAHFTACHCASAQAFLTAIPVRPKKVSRFLVADVISTVSIIAL